MMTEYGLPICYCIASIIQEQLDNPNSEEEEEEEEEEGEKEVFNSYSLETGTNASTDGGEDYEDVVVVPVNVHPRPHPGRRNRELLPQISFGGECADGEEEEEMEEEMDYEEGPVTKRHKSSPPSFTRDDWKSRAFKRKMRGRQRRHAASKHRLQVEAPLPLQDIDSVEHLSRVLSTNLERELMWDRDDPNPIYNSTASSKVDCTLRKTNVTYCSLSQTMSNASRSSHSTTNKSHKKVSFLESGGTDPPQLPPKPSTRVIYSEIEHGQPHVDSCQEGEREGGAVATTRTSVVDGGEEEDEEEEEEEEEEDDEEEEERGESNEQDGMPPPGLGRQDLIVSCHKSRIVAPGEIMRVR